MLALLLEIDHLNKSFGPAIPLLGLYLKNPETPIQKNLFTPMFIVAQFTIAKYWKQRKCPPVNEGIKNYGTFTQWHTTQQNLKFYRNFTLWKNHFNLSGF